MPPFLPRKRSTPPASPRPTPLKKAKLSDVLDAESRNTPGSDKPRAFSLGSDGSESSLSDVDSDEFEDVSPAVKHPESTKHEEEDEDDEIEWEDAGASTLVATPAQTPLADGPIELVFRKDNNEIDYGTATAATTGKKGPTKREKEARVRTHQMHVQLLLWHNSIRNRWISDSIVQQTLVNQLPPQIKKEVEKWKVASGLVDPEAESKSRGRRMGKGKAVNARQERDWGRPSQRMEKGKPNMSNGDPLISLMKVLAAYWKKRFAITAPGLRKRGYGTKQALKQIIYSFRNDEHDPEEHGERIRDIEEFREVARRCEGSRDAGAQLFTALLRAVGIESRLVASLQPTGFGWTKAEQQFPRKPAKAAETDTDTSSYESDHDDSVSLSEITKSKPVVKANARTSTRDQRGTTSKPINLDTDVEEDDTTSGMNEDDSVVDVTPTMPKRRPQKYDRDNPYPIYWTEAISPITNQVLPVSPLVLDPPVASTPEILAAFEPRGVKADRTKTVMAYVIAYSADGTAKDVTVRYLKKRIWPGKTKGFRFPVEKIPIYNKNGKVKRYEDYDWFRRVMSGYQRPDALRTPADDVEDAHDLVPQEPEKKEVKDDVDTLQSLKASADFVLERFLRREEALRPGAEPDRKFVSGKGENLKEELVYRRSDVLRCLTAESWHKEGRRPREGEAPLKLVPVRAVTLARKREAEDYERRTGEKQTQGLYSWDQTEYIIPPPIENGVIPKNAYGNIDCFVPSMVPKGAVHVPLRGTVRICKKLDIDFAEAVTGFEFGNKMAVPVITGVVVAKENEKAVIEAWTEFNEKQRQKEESKMEKLVLDLWRKFVMGLRIRERIQDTYGDVVDDTSIYAAGNSKDQPINLEDEGDMPGAALPIAAEDDFGGGFIVDDEELAIPEDLEMVHHEPRAERSRSMRISRGLNEYPTPVSVSPAKTNGVSQNKSLLQAADETTTASELSSAPNESDFDLQPAKMEEMERAAIPAIPASKARIEVSIPKFHRQGPTPSNTVSRTAQDTDESEDEQSESLEDETNDDDAYKPVRRSGRKTAKTEVRRVRSQTKTQTRRTSTRVRRGGRQSKSRVDLDDRDDEDEVVTPKTKRASRRLRRDSAVVTSPYFES
ncbi:uncharacterized protein PV06_01802 [Exophiala oligosperma]|uniref:Rad4 beta-hairpin domain-containing protein n=1 Tax=Exophiala oligosperma TaxID=215243 RepID=A0A0D2B1S4_9EURO|nr:uncharacterized protein PV06_01802 [Exophiala oligosperma]KIW46111.1 hypothetical protein PV06_01802 [Exophiala oligosperma]